MKRKLFNPPPNNLVPSSTKGAAAPSVAIGKISLKNQDPDVEAGGKNAKERSTKRDTIVTIMPSIQQGVLGKPVKPWYNDRKKVDQIRLRVILCTNPDYAQDVMDYMAQRYNEYQALETTSQDVKKINKFLDNVARQTDTKTMGSAYPDGPLDTDFLTKKIKTKKSDIISYSIPGMQGVFVYDNSLSNVIKKGNKGEALLNNKQGKVFSTSVNGKITELDNLEILAGAIDFNIGALSKDQELAQLSCYAFTYYDSDVFLEQSNLQKPNGSIITTPLQSGMGFITSKTVLGSKSVYPGISLDSPSYGKQGALQEESPDNDIFADMRGVDYLKRMEIFDLLSENFYDSMIMSGKGNKNFSNISPEMASEIKYKNYFSNLWLSRDKQENIRYMFSFDKQSFLRENSMYSQLYLNDQIARTLMSGGEGLSKQDSSKILDIKMTRRRVHRDKITPSNSLGTMVKRKPYENNEREQEKIIGNPDVESISVGNSGVEFYSGFDSYQEELRRQSSGIYQYGVTFYLQDSAPLYLMTISKNLKEKIDNLNSISDFIINSGGTSPKKLTVNVGSAVLYDAVTDTRQQSLKNISILGSTADSLVSDAIRFYIKSMSMFVPSLSDIDKLTENLITFANEPEMENLHRISDIIGEFRQKLEQILEVQFPNGYHDDRYTEPDVLKRKGFCQRKYNILQITHYFDDLHDVKESYRTGYCFISPDDGDSLGVLTSTGLQTRASQEFKKYFSLVDGSQLSGQEIFEDFYRQGSYSYFSPETIYVNGRQTINQSNFISDDSNQTEYDIDLYAHLLMDLVVLKNNKNRLLQITDQGNAVSPNGKLFENLTHALTSKDCLISEDDLSISDFFAVPKPKRQSDVPTATKAPQIKLKKVSPFTVLPSILGGMKDDSPGTVSFYNDQKNSILNKGFEDDLNKDPSDVIPGFIESNQPVKLAFSILGQMELTVPGIKEDADKLTLTRDNIKQTLTSKLIAIPNQIKSMLIVATDMEGQDFGDGIDAVRNLATDLEPAHPQQSISTTAVAQKFPPYQNTLDPMLVYSKMTAFWLNYRHLCVVEYLSGFENGKTTGFINKYIDSVSPRSETFSTIRKKEVWEKITPDSVEQLAGKNVLCRVRLANEKENISLTPDAAPSRQIQFSHKELFNLPLYDEYFILKA